MKKIKHSLLALLSVMCCAVFATSCDKDDSSDEEQSGTEQNQGSNQDSNDELESESSSNYKLSDFVGIWFSMDYDSTLSEIETYTAQGNLQKVLSMEKIYGMEITATGEINEKILYMSSSNTSEGEVHKTFVVSGSFAYWMMRDAGNYLSGVVVEGDEILYEGKAYYEIKNTSLITYITGDLYWKR